MYGIGSFGSLPSFCFLALGVSIQFITGSPFYCDILNHGDGSPSKFSGTSRWLVSIRRPDDAGVTLSIEVRQDVPWWRCRRTRLRSKVLRRWEVSPLIIRKNLQGIPNVVPYMSYPTMLKRWNTMSQDVGYYVLIRYSLQSATFQGAVTWCADAA